MAIILCLMPHLLALLLDVLLLLGGKLVARPMVVMRRVVLVAVALMAFLVLVYLVKGIPVGLGVLMVQLMPLQVVVAVRVLLVIQLLYLLQPPQAMAVQE
jgi:hypothetical protein